VADPYENPQLDEILAKFGFYKNGPLAFASLHRVLPPGWEPMEKISFAGPGKLIEKPLWRGLLMKPTPEKLRLSVAVPRLSVSGLAIDSLGKQSDRLKDFSPFNTRAEIITALRWYRKADEEDVRVDAFISFWLSILMLIRSWHSISIGGDPPERRRFRDYIKQRLQLKGEAEEVLFQQLDKAYSLRHEILKGSQHDIDLKSVWNVASIARKLLHFEVFGALPL
jgi:hypothetical protein